MSNAVGFIGTQLRTGKSSSQGNGRYYGSSGSRSTGIGLNESESQHSEERKHEAMATVRLVNRDGDVIWAMTEESLGAKFKGASADVADRIAKRAWRSITAKPGRLPLAVNRIRNQDVRRAAPFGGVDAQIYGSGVMRR